MNRNVGRVIRAAGSPLQFYWVAFYQQQGNRRESSRGHDYERQYVFHVRQSGQSGATDVGP